MVQAAKNGGKNLDQKFLNKDMMEKFSGIFEKKNFLVRYFSIQFFDPKFFSVTFFCSLFHLQSLCHPLYNRLLAINDESDCHTHNLNQSINWVINPGHQWPKEEGNRVY